eukprot:2906045-Rhodomonas_salina.1
MMRRLEAVFRTSWALLIPLAYRDGYPGTRPYRGMYEPCMPTRNSYPGTRVGGRAAAAAVGRQFAPTRGTQKGSPQPDTRRLGASNTPLSKPTPRALAIPTYPGPGRNENFEKQSFLVDVVLCSVLILPPLRLPPAPCGGVPPATTTTTSTTSTTTEATAAARNSHIIMISSVQSMLFDILAR